MPINRCIPTGERMVILYYNPDFKYTNRKIITITNKDNEMRAEINVAHLDTPDTINGHIIYNLGAISTLPTYLLDTDTDRRYFIRCLNCH